MEESFIQRFSFCVARCRSLTTFGIVYELGKESLLFFTHQQWEDDQQDSCGRHCANEWTIL